MHEGARPAAPGFVCRHHIVTDLGFVAASQELKEIGPGQDLVDALLPHAPALGTDRRILAATAHDPAQDNVVHPPGCLVGAQFAAFFTDH
jgi:hypothetical protein